MDQQKTGKFLKELRKKKGVTQEQFAEMLGASNRSVSRWEKGKVRIWTNRQRKHY